MQIKLFFANCTKIAQVTSKNDFVTQSGTLVSHMNLK